MMNYVNLLQKPILGRSHQCFIVYLLMSYNKISNQVIILPQLKDSEKYYINPLLCDVLKSSDTILKSFKVHLTILRHCEVKGEKHYLVQFTTRETDTSDTSATRTTGMLHECYTNDTS